MLTYVDNIPTSLKQGNKRILVSKEEMVIEKVKERPFEVINEMLTSFDIDDLRYGLRTWLILTIQGQQMGYEILDECNTLLYFYEHLVPFLDRIEAIDDVYEKEKASNEQISIDFTHAKFASHAKFLQVFYQEFPIQFIRRQLYSWLDAALSVKPPVSENMDPGSILFDYYYTVCITEAAYVLIHENR